MGNRTSSHKNKSTVSGKHPVEVPQEHIAKIVVDRSDLEKSQEADFNGPYNETTEDLSVIDNKQCPPTPCPLYKKSDQLQNTIGHYTNQSLLKTDRVSCYTHAPFATAAAAAMNKEDIAHDFATESENDDNEIDTGTIQCLEADIDDNKMSPLADEDDVYDRINPRKPNIWPCRTNSMDDEGVGHNFAENPEYFIRNCSTRNSRQTNSSIADSAYTASSNNSDHSCSEDYFCLNCMSCRAQNMEYMIDVFKRTLQRDLRVEDILQDLHCIDDRRKEEIGKKSRESRQGAVDMLIDSIKCSEERGKWQNFTEALERSGYNFIVKLLKGETENAQEQNKQILSLLQQRLINNIHVDECLDKLYEDQLLNEKDKEDIESEKKNHGSLAAACKMFDIVPTRSPNWDKRLSGILEECGLSDVAKLLQFSQEPSTLPISGETELPCKDSHSKHHYESICSSRKRPVAMPYNVSHDRTNDSDLSSETGKIIIGLRKSIQTIEEKTELNISAVKELKGNHHKDIKDLKHLAGAAKHKMQTLNEQEVEFHDEIKSELSALNKRIADMELGHQTQFDELKNSLLDIKCAIAALTKLVNPSPPEACQRFERNMTLDSGFSCGSDSFTEEYRGSEIYSGVDIEEDCSTHF